MNLLTSWLDIPGVKKVIKLGLDQWNQDGTSTTKTNRDELWFWKFSSNMEKVEANYADVSECSDLRKDWRAAIFIIIRIGEREREIFNTFTWNEKIRDDVETEEDDIMVKTLFQKFEDYCLPRKNMIVERRRFFTRNRQHDETIDAYITQLRNLSSPWEFRDVKKGLILYKLFNGIQSNKIRDTRLRKGADLTFKKAVDMYRADETINYEMKIIKQEIDVDAVWRNRKNNDNRDKMQHTAWAATSTTNNQRKCKYCGKQHLPKQCPAFGQTCIKCGKKNHWANCCNARIIGENQTTEDYVTEAVTEVAKKTMKAEVQSAVKKIRNKEEQVNQQKKQQIDSMTRGYDAQKKEATLVMKMNDKNVRIKLDTGAEVNVMPSRVFSQIADREDIEQNNVKLKGYGGSAIPVIGGSFIRCAYNNIYEDVTFYIVESLRKTALGLESCQDFKLFRIMDQIKHLSSGKAQEDADSKKLETKTKSIKGLSDKALKKKI